MTVSITGWGTALPERVLHNRELAERLDVSADWIFQRTGISGRHIAGEHDSTSALATAAATEAMGRANVTAADIDLVIVATVTPDRQLPATASLVQANLGCSRAGAFDLNAGCAGFLFALAQAQAAIESGAATRVLVCGADVLSRITDYSDARSCILFGDGAGAVVVEASADALDLGPFLLRSDGSEPELLTVRPDEGLIRMNGREVYRRAVEEMAGALVGVLDERGLSADDVDLVVVHQANARIVNAVVARLGLDPQRVMVSIESVGNTSAASIPLALSDAAEAGRLQAGAVVALAAFGAGFAWGAGLVRWGTSVPAPRRAARWPALVGTSAHLLEFV